MFDEPPKLRLTFPRLCDSYEYLLTTHGYGKKKTICCPECGLRATSVLLNYGKSTKPIFTLVERKIGKRIKKEIDTLEVLN